jgi:4-amino-4-deoxy-L-arabinose transferase-like glycosyltransferase
MESATHPHPRSWNSTRLRDRLRALPLPRPELAVLLALAALLYLWALSRNGWANDYYSAAVRSMAGSWHDFLYGSFDAKGLMTVDKPPAALWVEALSVKLFGFNSLAILVPQALMGTASVGVLYDLTRRRFGRAAGTLAGLALALTPVVVAISRHNNPDALLVLCTVGALWCFVRALDHGATKWLVGAAVLVGLGFETKMGAALLVVPGMALAWLWVAPRGRLVALRQLAVAGSSLLAVALAWPVLVWLTPTASRPWISGTSDNSIWSLIWEYNGLGRLEGQTGGPGSLGTSGTFGGATGPFRLLNEALGGQAGWLLGAALVGGLGIAVMSRLRLSDPRTGWIIAVGGAFAVTAVAFSFAGGIFHPYYTSLLAPFAAALVGATFGQVLASEQIGRGRAVVPTGSGAGSDEVAGPIGARSDAGREVIFGRMLGALAIGAGAIVELVVIDHSATDLDWLVVPLVVVSVAAVVALLFADGIVGRLGARPLRAAHLRTAALVVAFGLLLTGPAIWSVETLGHPTSSTFPAGGPESAGGMGMGGGPGGMTGGSGGFGTGVPSVSGATGAAPGESGGAVGQLFGEGSGSESAAGAGAATGMGVPPSFPAGMSSGPGGMFGGENLSRILEYTEAHGGGTIVVDSQSGASAAIIEEGAEVAGIGGFSGKESSVSTAWLKERIEAGAITWIYTSGLGGMAGGAPGGISGQSAAGAGVGGGGDTRTGSESAIDAVVKQCSSISASAYESGWESAESTAGTAESSGAAPNSSVSGSGTLYRCGDS